MTHPPHPVQRRVTRAAMFAALPWLWWMLSACFGTAPSLLAVTPTEAQPGDTVIVQARDVTEDTVFVVTLDTRERVIPMVPDGVAFRVQIPEDLPAHQYTVRLRGPAGASEAQQTLDVWTPDTEPACDKRYALDTEVSRTQRKIAFDRVLPGGTTERHAFFGDDLEAITYEATEGCSAVWLHAKGKRWLIADDAEHDLSRHAQQIATVLQLPLR